MGIYDWEQSVPRDIIINAEIRLKNDNILRSHDLADSVDYEAIVNTIKDLATNNFALVEDFTNQVANIIMSMTMLIKQPSKLIKWVLLIS
jgi:FolB domain-containing protein